MEPILIRERYKVVRVLHTEGDYALVEAVDIEDRETPVYLLNLYEGELYYRYGRVFAAVASEDCPAFRRVFLDGETLAAVFDGFRGVNIDQMFYGGDRWSWRARLDYAEALMHEALTLANLPPEISCAALLSENVFFRPNDVAISLRYQIAPMEGMNARELALLAGDQLKKILPRRAQSVDAELDLMERLDREGFPSIVPFYAAWRDAREKIREEYEDWESKGFFRRWLAVLLRRARRKAKRKLKRR